MTLEQIKEALKGLNWYRCADGTYRVSIVGNSLYDPGYRIKRPALGPDWAICKGGQIIDYRRTVKAAKAFAFDHYAEYVSDLFNLPSL